MKEEEKMKIKADLHHTDSVLILQAYAEDMPKSFALPPEATTAQTAEFLNVLSNIVVDPHHLVVKAFEDAFGVPFEEEGAECEKIADQA